MTMMSIFSSVDAFCAESYGRKVSFSVEGGPAAKPKAGGSTVVKSDSGSKKPSPAKDKNPKQEGRCSRRPRFAPELDGVHCFETIVPY